MKLRSGFVSNSSTSSFIIYGARFSQEELEKMFPGEKDAADILETLMTGTVLESYSGEGDYYYIGRSWASVKNDETGREFKASVETALKTILKKDVDCDTYEEAWYNG